MADALPAPFGRRDILADQATAVLRERSARFGFASGSGGLELPRIAFCTRLGELGLRILDVCVKMSGFDRDLDGVAWVQ